MKRNSVRNQDDSRGRKFGARSMHACAMAVLTLIGAALAATAQQEPEARHYVAHLTQTQHQTLERKAKELYDATKAPDWSQRSDHDHYVIVSRMLA